MFLFGKKNNVVLLERRQEKAIENVFLQLPRQREEKVVTCKAGAGLRAGLRRVETKPAPGWEQTLLGELDGEDYLGCFLVLSPFSKEFDPRPPAAPAEQELLCWAELG